MGVAVDFFFLIYCETLIPATLSLPAELNFAGFLFQKTQQGKEAINEGPDVLGELLQ